MAPAVLLGMLAVALLAAPAQGANATSFSGEATVVHAVVNNPLGGAPLLNFRLGHAGPLPSTGGSDVDEILNANVSQAPLTLTASVIRAATQGSGSTATSVARAAGLNLTLASLVAVTSTTLKSTATATCGANGAKVTGASVIEGLVINGTAVTVTGARNQVVDIGPVHLVINQQIKNVDSFGSITVNALRITVTDPLNNNAVLATVVLSSAHADVTCPAQTGGPRGAIGGPCADPAYYGIFYNTASTVALTFRFQWHTASGIHTVQKVVPAGAIFRTWEHWSKPGTNLSVAYKNPNTGNWVTLASDVSVHGYFPDCTYKHGFEYPNP